MAKETDFTVNHTIMTPPLIATTTYKAFKYVDADFVRDIDKSSWVTNSWVHNFCSSI